jgi:hypothetical protein
MVLDGRSHIFPLYSRRGVVASIAAAASLGCLGVLGAALLDPGLHHYESPLFPLVRAAIEDFGTRSLVALAGAGFLVGLFRGAPWPVIGLSTMALFPLFSVAEMLVDPTSHNLFPLEWLMYAAATLPAMFGAYVGTRLGRPGRKS